MAKSGARKQKTQVIKPKEHKVRQDFNSAQMRNTLHTVNNFGNTLLSKEEQEKLAELNNCVLSIQKTKNKPKIMKFLEDKVIKLVTYFEDKNYNVDMNDITGMFNVRTSTANVANIHSLPLSEFTQSIEAILKNSLDNMLIATPLPAVIEINNVAPTQVTEIMQEENSEKNHNIITPIYYENIDDDCLNDDYLVEAFSFAPCILNSFDECQPKTQPPSLDNSEEEAQELCSTFSTLSLENSEDSDSDYGDEVLYKVATLS